jgi:SAM-dependent methyltransferase
MIDTAHRRHFGSVEELQKVRRYQQITWGYIKTLYYDLPHNSILDVGASEGYLKDLCSSWYCGIDISPIGDYVIKGTILDVSKLVPDRLFDLIIYEHVLEHVDEPLSNLYTAYNLLKPNGLLFIAVPYASCPWAWEEVSHLHLFNEVNLEKMLIKAQFDIIEWVKVELRKDAIELWMVSKKS